jgi:hypothetical protein
MEGTNVVRIKFSSSSYRLRPSIAKTLAMLRKFMRVEGDRQERAADWQVLAGVELDDLVRQLATGGQRIEAMEIIARRKGISHTEAKRLVDGISERVCAPEQTASKSYSLC